MTGGDWGRRGAALRETGERDRERGRGRIGRREGGTDLEVS